MTSKIIHKKFNITKNIFPVLIFHGINDDCNNSQITDLKRIIMGVVEGSYAECIDIGG